MPRASPFVNFQNLLTQYHGDRIRMSVLCTKLELSQLTRLMSTVKV